jgi:hypothetical protein
MSIVGAFDVHRRQLTVDYLDTVSGEVRTTGTAGCSPGQTTISDGRPCSCGYAQLLVLMSSAIK